MRVTGDHYIKGTEPEHGFHPGLSMRKARKYSGIYGSSFPKGCPDTQALGQGRAERTRCQHSPVSPTCFVASAFSSYKADTPEKPSII